MPIFHHIPNLFPLRKSAGALGGRLFLQFLYFACELGPSEEVVEELGVVLLEEGLERVGKGKHFVGGPAREGVQVPVVQVEKLGDIS
jgi:hypothetical protein